MSVFLETAAAALSSLTFTSTVIQIGYKISKFLADLVDAPAEINSLREFVDENLLLANAYLAHLRVLETRQNENTNTFRACEKDPSQWGAVSSSRGIVKVTEKSVSCTAQLSNAISALSRELNSLDHLLRKNAKVKPVWINFRHVLGKRRIESAITNLNRTKFALSSGLAIANSQLATLEHAKIEEIFQKCSERMTSSVEELRDSLLHEMNTQHQIVVTTITQQNGAALDSRRFKKHTVRPKEKSRQSEKRESKQLALVRKELRNASISSSQRHQKTQHLLMTKESRLESKLTQIHQAITKLNATTNRKTGQLIHFIGARRDLVLVYLLPLRSQLDAAVEIVSNQKPTRIQTSYTAKLQSHFQYLVASAAQEEAARHPMSTASSFDRWLYSMKIGSNHKRMKALSPVWDEAVQNKDTGCPINKEIHRRRYKTRHLTTVTVETECGLVRISALPYEIIRKDNDEPFEARLTFLPRPHHGSMLVNVHLRDSSAPSAKPTLYAQINAFDIVDLAEYDQLYRRLFRYGSVRDIDYALRQGKVSPYHVSVCGINLCIYYVVRFGRLELLHYLDDNGVGLLNIDGNYSALLGFTRGLSLTYLGSSDISLEAYRATLDYIKDQAHISSSVLSGLLLMASVPDSAEQTLDTYMQARSLLRKWTDCLKQQQLTIEQQDETGRTPLLSALMQVGFPSSLFIQLLLEFGANVDATDDQGRNAIQLAIYSKSLLCEESTRSWSELTEEKLCLLLGAGADIHHRDKGGRTPSQDARRYDCWGEWCRALERNGQDVKKVVESDGESWLLGTDSV